jgi:ribosome biogenesis GTPase
MADALEGLGLDERVRTLFDDLVAEGLVLGRVIRVDRGQCVVGTGDGPIRAEPSTKLRASAELGEGVPAVGDWVALRCAPDMDVSQVEHILPRTSAITRKVADRTTGAQVLAANVDVVVIVHALAGDPNLSRIERELVVAWESGGDPVIVLNKSDLCDDLEQALADVEAVACGVPVVLMSALEGTGATELERHITPGRTAVLLGPSGVGKSTIVNRLAGSDIQETFDVREGDQKGRHTTIARELLELPSGALLIDTPGLRALALWEVDEGIAMAFADIEELSGGCRFRDCTHSEEPGCAVRDAVDAGELDARRLDSFHRLQREMEHLAAKKDARLRAEKDRKWKEIHRSMRHHPKRGR